MARKRAVCPAAEQGTVRDKTPPGEQSVTPFFVGEFAIQMHISTIVSNGIGEHTAGTAGARRKTDAAVERMVVDLQRPKRIPMRPRQSGRVAGPSPSLVFVDTGAVHVVIGDSDRVN